MRTLQAVCTKNTILSVLFCNACFIFSIGRAAVIVTVVAVAVAVTAAATVAVAVAVVVIVEKQQ